MNGSRPDTKPDARASGEPARRDDLPLTSLLAVLAFDTLGALVAFAIGISLFAWGGLLIGKRWYDFAVVATGALICAPAYIAATRGRPMRRATLLGPVYGLVVAVIAASFWSIEAVARNTAPNPLSPPAVWISTVITTVLISSPVLLVGGPLMGAAHGALLSALLSGWPTRRTTRPGH